MAIESEITADDIIKRFEESIPVKYRYQMEEKKTPTEVVRRYGPYVLCISRTSEFSKDIKLAK
jgi:hypothetical protein